MRLVALTRLLGILFIPAKYFKALTFHCFTKAQLERECKQLFSNQYVCCLGLRTCKQVVRKDRATISPSDRAVKGGGFEL